jgi:hypothetical protein
MILHIDEIFKLSFPDANVIKSFLNLKKKIFLMHIDYAWLDVDSGRSLKNIHLNISNWKELLVKKYETETEIWIYETHHSKAFLKDICEFEFSLQKLIVKGFSFDNNQWYEWEFENAKILINYDDY